MAGKNIDVDEPEPVNQNILITEAFGAVAKPYNGETGSGVVVFSEDGTQMIFT